MDPDAQQNPPAVITPTVVEIPVGMFEGEYVRKMIGKLPAMELEMPVGYSRHTHLKFQIEVRVRNVTFAEDKKTGDLIRVHELAWEDYEITLVGAYTAEEADPGVGGSAAAGAEQDEEPQPLALEARTDSDTRPEEENPDGRRIDPGF